MMAACSWTDRVRQLAADDGDELLRSGYGSANGTVGAIAMHAGMAAGLHYRTH